MVTKQQHSVGGGFSDKFFGLRHVAMAPAEDAAGASAAAAGAAAAAAGPKDLPPPSAAEIAELRAAKAQLDTINAGKAASDAEAQRLRAAAAKDAEGKGELQKALDLQKARLAELEPYEQEIKAFRAQQATEMAAIETRKAALTDVQRAALDSAATLEGKRAVLAMIDAAPGAKVVHAAGTTGTAPAGDAPINFTEAFRDPVKWAAAKLKNPQGASEWMNAQLSGGRPPSTLDLLRSKSKSA